MYTRPPKRTLTPACSLGLADFQALPHLLQEALTDTWIGERVLPVWGTFMIINVLRCCDAVSID